MLRACGAVALAAFAARYVLASLATFEPWLPWVALAGVAVAVATLVPPLFRAADGWRRERKGRELAMAEDGKHVEGGVALIAEARSLPSEGRKIVLDTFHGIHERRRAREAAA